MESGYLSAVEALGLDLGRLWQQLSLAVDDRATVCQLLLGYSRQDIAIRLAAQRCQCSETDLRLALDRQSAKAQSLSSTLPTPANRQSHLSTHQSALEQLAKADRQVRDRLSGKIYPAFAQLMGVPREAIAGNWVKILNFLYDPQNGYRLQPPPQLNSDNFQGSLGRQVFLPPPDRAIAQAQREGTRFYQRGLYYQALNAFAAAWRQEQTAYSRGNPEILIYLNNALVELQRDRLQNRHIECYLLAVVVPFHHNQGQVAAEVLRGAAQLQWQTNWHCLQQGRLDRALDLAGLPTAEIVAAASLARPIALQIMVVNDPNHVYDADNPTAEQLAALAPGLNLMAVVGHYSSEMTEKALPFYALQGLPLVNASSTADTLSALSTGLQQSFFRLTTPDRDNAAALLNYLAGCSATQPQRVALIYNRNSQYCLSYRAAVRSHIAQHSHQFELLPECDRISEQPDSIHRYLQEIEAKGADILLVIPDGGLEPNSLNNAGLISRLNLKSCLIAGSATFYQENVLHWMYERDRPQTVTAPAPIVACVPWHWRSCTNGYQSQPVAQQFCRLGQALWGAGRLTWRSATTFDALLMLQTVLARWPCCDRMALLRQLHHYFRVQQKSLQGVTGAIQFASGCDRLHPPAEIVTVQPDAAQQRWVWDIPNPTSTKPTRKTHA
ncbi:ABC transporter substrate-binding protein [Sphaerothrix gracilis]|uniref:ABC transporter substrate-binding protein n=1 Tax=Sphaerothrix gracilis TaxID=3151835 RepID=UPI0031FCCC0B